MEYSLYNSQGLFLISNLRFGPLLNLFQTVLAYKDRNDDVKQLCEKLKEVYNFITDAERLPRLSETPTDALSLLIRQTIECAYFIRGYSERSLGWILLIFSVVP